MAGAYEEGKGGFCCRRSGGLPGRAAAEGGTMSIQSLGGVAPKFGGLTLTNGMSPLQDSQLVALEKRPVQGRAAQLVGRELGESHPADASRDHKDDIFGMGEPGPLTCPRTT